MLKLFKKAILFCLPALLVLMPSLVSTQTSVTNTKAKITPALPPTQKPKLSEFMGINFHTVLVHNPSLYAQTCRLARDYHAVSWDVWDTKNGLTKFPESPFTQNGVSWEHVYGTWVKAGYKINASLMDLEKYIINTPNNCFSTNALKELQSYSTRVAESFGPGKKWPLLESVQVENEPSASTVTQYKALFKSMATGLRAGNPQLLIVTCAMSGESPSASKYDKPIASLAGMEKLFDVIAMHTYALKTEWPTWETSYPEDTSIKYLKKIDRMINYKKTHPAVANKPIWITEFGYDAGTIQAQTRHPLWKSATEPEQALWIVRSFLVFSEKDIERAYLYWFEDDDTGSLHGASGIVRKLPNSNTRRPKPAFYAMRHLFNALGSFRFKRVISKQHEGVYTFEYADDANHLAWVVWSATKGKADTTHTLTNLPSNKVIMQTLTLNDAQIASTNLDATDNRLTLTVGETPKFLFFQQPAGQ